MHLPTVTPSSAEISCYPEGHFPAGLPKCLGSFAQVRRERFGPSDDALDDLPHVRALLPKAGRRSHHTGEEIAP